MLIYFFFSLFFQKDTFFAQEMDIHWLSIMELLLFW